MKKITNYKDEIVGVFNIHCVPMLFEYEINNEFKKVIYSAFVISINENWFLITAGHCLKEVDSIIENGFKIHKSEFLDCVNRDSKYNHGVPFDINSFSTFYFKEDKFDYGIIELTEYYKLFLIENGVKALDEDTWEKQPSNPDYYFVLGVPQCLTDLTKTKTRLVTTLHNIIKCDYIPSEFEKTDAPTFFGKISFGEDMNSIEGISGGPIYSVKQLDNGRLKYWICAVQSRWIKDSKLIAACYTSPFIAYIKEIMQNQNIK